VNTRRPSRPPAPAGRVWALLVGVLTLVGLLGFTATAAPATGRVAAQTRVGASASGLAQFVGPIAHVSPGQGQVGRPPQPMIVVATGVAAETVLDRVAATQGPRDIGSALPKSFNLSTASGENVWVNPNGTKHIWEETRGLTFGRNIAEQQRLAGLADAVDNAVVGNWEQMQVSRGWELIFSQARSEGLNPVLKHARYLGGN
jgi:hypothetical protein